MIKSLYNNWKIKITGEENKVWNFVSTRKEEMKKPCGLLNLYSMFVKGVTYPYQRTFYSFS